MTPGRWIRLDTTWSKSKWVAKLPASSRLAWVELLCYMKAHGDSVSVKALCSDVAARDWGVTVTAVDNMIEAAIADGALKCDGDSWVITGWYRQTDTTNAKRQATYRQRQKELTGSVTPVTRYVTPVTPTETETRTETVKEKIPSVSKRNVVGDRVDLVLSHTEQQATKAERRSEFARLIFTYWAARIAKDPKHTQWDEKRRTRLTARLKENQDDVCELLCVVDGALKDDFHTGTNDRGKKFLQIQTIFRDREMVEKLSVLSPHFGKDVHPFMAAP